MRYLEQISTCRDRFVPFMAEVVELVTPDAVLSDRGTSLHSASASKLCGGVLYPSGRPAHLMVGAGSLSWSVSAEQRILSSPSLS